jgi:hypothetical protein
VQSRSAAEREERMHGARAQALEAPGGGKRALLRITCWVPT